MSAQLQQQRGPPYRPTVWSLGGTPSKNVDLPITAVFLALFIVGAATHMTILQVNRKRDHKFLFNGALFGFCMSRIVTCTLRIASICLPSDVSLSIAAAIFVGAGVLIIFIVNLIWSQRMLRSLQPTIGWHPITSIAVRIIYVLIGCTLAINITSTVQSFYTLDKHIRSIDRSLQLYGLTFLAIVSSLPLLVLAITFALPRKTSPDHFGKGTLRTKTIVLLVGATLITLGAWYRCATMFKTPVPRSQPLPAYFHKACFYIFNFGVEIITVYMYAIARVDRRFHVPNGAKGPGSYAVQHGGEKTQGEMEAGESSSTMESSDEVEKQ